MQGTAVSPMPAQPARYMGGLEGLMLQHAPQPLGVWGRTGGVRHAPSGFVGSLLHTLCVPENQPDTVSQQ